jgi:hypothetical protein
MRQTLMDPAERKRNLKSARTFLKYLVRGSDVPAPDAACKSCK